jgi:hypothetical protein
VDLKIFQHLRDAGEAGLSSEELAEKTASGIDPVLVRRLMGHLAAVHVIGLSKGRWHATKLSNGLAEPQLQASIEFCFDSSRPSFGQYVSDHQLLADVRSAYHALASLLSLRGMDINYLRARLMGRSNLRTRLTSRSSHGLRQTRPIWRISQVSWLHTGLVSLPGSNSIL